MTSSVKAKWNVNIALCPIRDAEGDKYIGAEQSANGQARHGGQIGAHQLAIEKRGEGRGRGRLWKSKSIGCANGVIAAEMSSKTSVINTIRSGAINH